MKNVKDLFKLYNLVIYSGVVAVLFLIATFYLGITHRDIELHEKFGITTLIFALIHGGLNLYRYIKRHI